MQNPPLQLILADMIHGESLTEVNINHPNAYDRTFVLAYFYGIFDFTDNGSNRYFSIVREQFFVNSDVIKTD